MVLYILLTLSFRSKRHVYTCESTEVSTHHSACDAASIHMRCDRMKSNIGNKRTDKPSVRSKTQRIGVRGHIMEPDSANTCVSYLLFPLQKQSIEARNDTIQGESYDIYGFSNIIPLKEKKVIHTKCPKFLLIPPLAMRKVHTCDVTKCSATAETHAFTYFQSSRRTKINDMRGEDNCRTYRNHSKVCDKWGSQDELFALGFSPLVTLYVGRLPHIRGVTESPLDSPSQRRKIVVPRYRL